MHQKIFVTVSASVVVGACATSAQESESKDLREAAPWIVDWESPAREVCFVVRIGDSRRVPVFDYAEYFVDLEVLAPLPQPDVYVFVSMTVGAFEDTSDYNRVGSKRLVRLSTDDIYQFANSGTVHLPSRGVRLGRFVADTEDPAEACEPATAFRFKVPDPTAPEPVRSSTTTVVTPEDMKDLEGGPSVAEMLKQLPRLPEKEATEP